MKIKFRKILAIPLCLHLLFSSPSIWALQPPSNLTNATASVNCASFCKQFIPSGSNISTNSVVAGLFNSDPWNTADDQICSELGQPTTSGFGKIPGPSASFTASGGACNNVSVTDNVLNKINANSSNLGITVPSNDPNYNSQVCIAAGSLANHCYYHNSQVETQCLAYAVITGLTNDGTNGNSSNSATSPSAINNEYILMGADFGAAAVCAIACASGNPVASTVCGAAASAVGATEIYMTIQQSTGPIGQLLSTNKTAKSMQYGSEVGGGLGALAGIVTAASGISRADSGSAKGGSPNSKARDTQTACGTAAIFAILGGLRTVSATNLQNSADTACKNINSLFSSSSSSSATSGSSTSNSGTSGIGGSSSSSSGSGSGAGGNSSFSGATASQLNQLSSCLQQSACSQTPLPPQCTNSYCEAQAGINRQSTASTDANLFTPTGNSGPLLQPLGNLDHFVKKATTEGAGAALAGIMPSSASGLANTLSQFANAAQKEGPSLAAALHMDSAYSSGGMSGGNKGGSNTGPDASLANLFGNGGAGGPMMMGAAPVTSFGEAPVNQDIWHTGSRLTIFQIVSEKTWRVSNRVEKFDPRPFDPRE